MDNNTKRREFCETQFKKISNNINRVKGIVGKNINNKKSDIVDGVEFKNDYDSLTTSEIGCILSHIKAINTAYNNGDEIALICEDDIYIEPYKLSKPLNYIVENAPKDWELLQLYSGGYIPEIKTLKINEVKYLKFKQDNWSFACYLINRKGMEKILNIVGYPYYIHYIKDKFPQLGVADLWIPILLNTYTVIPFCFGTNISLGSTIHNNHVDTLHVPLMYNYLKFLNNSIISNSKKVYIELIYDIKFISHIFSHIHLINNKDEADLIVENILSRNYSKRYSIPKIVIDREPWNDSKIKNCELVITTKLHPKHNLNYIYLPCYSSSFAEYGISPEKLIQPKPNNTKNKFCAYVYSNCDPSYKGVKTREIFFELLQSMSGGRVDSWGKCKNNMKIDNDNGHFNNSELFSEYKFVIAFENEYVDGYITEKITNPMLAGSIPIYLGDNEVEKHFNKDSFINVRDYTSFEDCIKYILYLDSNDIEYNKIYNRPWMKDNKLTAHFSWYDSTLGDFYEKLNSYIKL
jgi:hypothetical protein